MTSYLDQSLEPVTEAMTPELARKIAEMRATPEQQARVDELAEKSNEGLLTPAERAEYLARIDAVDVLSILQSKARRFLAGN